MTNQLKIYPEDESKKDVNRSVHVFIIMHKDEFKIII